MHINILEPVQYLIYAMAVLFDLRCESVIHMYMCICIYVYVYIYIYIYIMNQASGS